MTQGEVERFKAKICLLGDPSVGKTSLIRKFVMDKFSDDYISTIGTKVTKRETKVYRGDTVYELTLMIWDVEGLQKNLDKNLKDFQKFIPKGYLGNSEGIIIVFDLTRFETLKSVKGWYKDLTKEVGKDIPCVLLGNKNDRKHSIHVTDGDIKNIAGQLGFPYYKTSAKTGENVALAFNKIGDEIITRATGKPAAQLQPPIAQLSEKSL